MRNLWLTGAFLLLIPTAVSWSKFVREHGIHEPKSPIDVAQPVYAGYWRFLASARKAVPRGSSYTIHAATPADETQIFMLSVGLYEGRQPFPRTYWTPQPGAGAEAKYVLSYGSADCPADAIAMTPVDGGVVCTRGGR